MNELLRHLLGGWRIVFDITYEFGTDARRTYTLLENPPIFSHHQRKGIWS